MLSSIRKTINPPYSTSDLFVILGVLIIFLAVPFTIIAALTARKPAPIAAPTATPLHITKEYVSPGKISPGCIGEDESFSALFSGYLAARNTFNYRPFQPICEIQSDRQARVSAQWKGQPDAIKLILTTDDGQVFTSLPAVRTTTGGYWTTDTACFTNDGNPDSIRLVSYSVSVTNAGNKTVSNLRVSVTDVHKFAHMCQP